VYNIGGNNEWKNIDVVRLILQKLGKPESLITYVKDRPGHDLRYAIDASRICTELGWQPSVDFSHGIERTIEWYVHNERWWRRVITGEYTQYYRNQYENR
jgi:dTDP-glucose 4,6-dehydratase